MYWFKKYFRIKRKKTRQRIRKPYNRKLIWTYLIRAAYRGKCIKTVQMLVRYQLRKDYVVLIRPKILKSKIIVKRWNRITAVKLLPTNLINTSYPKPFQDILKKQNLMDLPNFKYDHKKHLFANVKQYKTCIKNLKYRERREQRKLNNF
jgi:hypothetical protein